MTHYIDTLPPYIVQEPDYELSPLTGMSRKHWLEAGKHVLGGVFRHVEGLSDPLFLPKQPGKSYPSQGNERATKQERSAAIFEATARTFNIAAPLIHEDPAIVINGIPLLDYYRYHFLELLTNENSSYFIGHGGDRSGPAQQTCELGSLAMWNLLLPGVFWERLTSAEQQRVAATFRTWGQGWTWPHNWRWFNVMMLTFLEHCGHSGDQVLLRDHLDHLLLHHAGDGWFRDAGYDYYTVHVFHLYGAVWSRFYGRKCEPARARIVDQLFDSFLATYPMLFGRDGQVNMYGRSILYRLGASAGLPAAMLDLDKRHHALAPGLARRLASGALLQFISHPKHFHQGLPALGFYGPFEPCIQKYSCSASPFWMFLNFMALTLPANAPFWVEREDPGHWQQLGSKQTSCFLTGPGLLLSNHGSSGAAELRPGKVHSSDPNYCRLVYSTAFPWEANTEQEAHSSSLSLKTHGVDEEAQLPKYIDVAGYRDGVLYRQATFEGGPFAPHVDMAAIVIPGGEIRVDRLRQVRATTLCLGHFSLPHVGGQKPKVETYATSDARSITLAVSRRQLAMTIVSGWDELALSEHQHLHPEEEFSTLIYAKATPSPGVYGPVRTLVSVLLHRADDEPWLEEQLNPVASINRLIADTPMHLGGLELVLVSGERFEVDFLAMDGACSRH